MRFLVVFLGLLVFGPFVAVGIWALLVFWVQDWSPKARRRKREDDEFWKSFERDVDFELRYWDEVRIREGS